MTDLLLATDRKTLHRADGACFDAAARCWMPGAGTLPPGPAIDAPAAVRWLQRESGTPCRIPVVVIGPREPAGEQYEVARALGRALAGLGLTVLCGGRQGVMEGVCRGVAEGGGLSVGLLPGDSAAEANPYVGVPIATGIGVARNALLARAGFCLIAVGGGYGTISEMAYGLQFGKPVFGLCGAPDIRGATILPDVAAGERAAARAALGLE